jgi:hypothetical protein
MDEFVKMDIFFFVATIELLVVGVLFAFVLWKFLRILNHVERIAEIAEKEAGNLKEDVAYVRGRLLGVLDVLFSFMPRRRDRRHAEEGRH